MYLINVYGNDYRQPLFLISHYGNRAMLVIIAIFCACAKTTCYLW